MTADKPSSAEGWALVDFMANVITDAQDAPHFTTAEHALMAAGELERGWLAARDRAVKAEALREAAGWLDGFEGPCGRESLYDRVGRQIIARLHERADRIEKGADA